MKRQTILFTLFLLLTGKGSFYGQSEPAGSKNLYGGFGYLHVSYDQLNIGQLNTALASNNYASITTGWPGFGGGGYFAIDNWLFGGGGTWIAEQRTTLAPHVTRFSGGYGHFGLGYILLKTRRSVLYPSIGVGGGGYTLLIGDNTATLEFPEQLKKPGGYTTIQAGGTLLNLQLSYQYFFSGENTTGFFVGLRVGYKYSPTTWKMVVNNTPMLNTPGINMNGMSVSLLLGGGGLSTRSISNGL